MEINRIAPIYDMSGKSLHNRECSSTGSEEAEQSIESSQKEIEKAFVRSTSKNAEKTAQASYGEIVNRLMQMSNEILKTAQENARKDPKTSKMKDIIKCLKTADKIAKGKKVPQKDKQLLMEMFPELYRIALLCAMKLKKAKQEKEKELCEDEDDSEEESQEKSITDGVESAIAASAEIMAAIL